MDPIFRFSKIYRRSAIRYLRGPDSANGIAFMSLLTLALIVIIVILVAQVL
jgi:hypothetical protein